MSASFASRIGEAIPTVQDQYHRLILAVGPARCGKTAALAALAQQHHWPKLNVNLALSERLLELTQKQRKVRIAGILHEVVRGEGAEVILLDNIEVLFARELEQDPLRVLQSVSRNRTIIAAWPGTVEAGTLTYAEPGHPEARRYSSPQACIIAVESPATPDRAQPRGETE
jgi:hypothetical protein